MRQVTPPLHRFRVYPNSGSSLYFEVQVFQNQRDMHRWCRKDCQGDFMGYDTKACTHSLISRRSLDGMTWRMLPIVGRIHLNRHFAGGGGVAHEMTHAALRYLERRRRTQQLVFDGSYDRSHELEGLEEDLALIVGNLVAQTTRKLWDLGVYSS